MAWILQTFHPLFVWSYRLHDWSSDWLARHLMGVKRSILIVAHLALFGFLFPDLRLDFGELAANLLIAILFLSPLSQIFRMRLLLLGMSLRREFGITMGYLATVHGVGYLLDPSWYDSIIAPLLVGSIWGDDPRLSFGIIAYALTLPLLLTSNALAQRNLGVRWKQLHRIVYVMFAFVIFHRFFDLGAPIMAMGEVALLLGAYALAKALAWKNFLPPLEEVIRLIAEDYRRYQQEKVEGYLATDAPASPQR